ncbi:MAG: DUF3783 domain-containing protein [Kosmotoga sp.]|nr:MAG: DUF3783 domain-containing protein [Kosmotoga sp.]
MEDTKEAIICYNIDLNELEKIRKEQGLVRLHLIDGTGMEDMLMSDIISNEPKEVDNSEETLAEDSSFIIFHDADGQTINTIIRNFRINKKSCVFATTTDTNLNWTLRELLAELVKEHKRFGN